MPGELMGPSGVARHRDRALLLPWDSSSPRSGFRFPLRVADIELLLRASCRGARAERWLSPNSWCSGRDRPSPLPGVLLAVSFVPLTHFCPSVDFS